jgi:hypothetical protein
MDKSGTDKKVLQTLKEEYCIPFSTVPTLTITPEIRMEYMQDPVRRDFLTQAVRKMEEKGPIEIVFWSPNLEKQMETSDRSLGSELPHTVDNLQDGNPRVYPQVGPQSQWLTCLNLKDMYFHLPIHPSNISPPSQPTRTSML